MTSIDSVEIDKRKPLFQLFFLENNENQGVTVEEVERIDFGEVEKHLEQGESVFITLKRKGKVETSLIEWEHEEESWYFSHI